MGIERRKSYFPSIELMNSPLWLEAEVNPKQRQCARRARFTSTERIGSTCSINAIEVRLGP